MAIDIFFIKLIVSFIVGGFTIALLSILAEKYPKISGIIISVPSTLPLGLFFIGWTQDKYAAIEATSVVPTSIAILLIFSIVYIYSAQYVKSKVGSITLANVASLSVWFILAFIVTYFKINNISLGILLYIAAFILSMYLLRFKTKDQQLTNKVRLEFNYKQLIWRILFGGTIIAISVILAKVLNPLWGGMFSVFPAAYLSSFNIIQSNKNKQFLFQIGKTIPYGTIFFLAYMVLAYYLFNLGIFIGTIASIIITIAFIVLFNKLFNKKS